MSVGLNLNMDKTSGTLKSTQTKNTNLNFAQNNTNSPVPSKTKFIAAASSIAGTIIPIIMIAKHQKKTLKFNSWKNINDILDIKYGVKEMTIVSGSAVAAGVIGGCLSDKEHKRIHKIKEGVFQFLNATLPTVAVGGVMKQLENSKKFNTIPYKIAGVLGGLLVGMPLAAAVANKITDPNDLEEDRKINAKDLVVNLDDALGALVLAKIPIVDKLHAEKLLPAIYAWCGYRAGKHE